MNNGNIIKSLNAIENQDIQFSDIFILEEIQQMQDLFSDATGVASLITTPNGTPITQPSNFCRLCNLVRSTEKGLANCFKSDKYTASNGQITTGNKLNVCMSAGLWDSGARISVDGKHIANWLIGQVRSEKFDQEFICNYAEEIGVDKVELIKAFQEVPIISASKFEKITKMLFVFANELSQKAYNNHLLKIKILEIENTNELLHKSEESLSITLQSIGDGVISTDNNGLITNMNHVAEKLCGWDLTEALGKQLNQVFCIVNSETRIPVENPVKKVLESKQIIGLSNHTVLISRDGSEFHISDSAAPVIGMNGVISGVVMAFSDITEEFVADEKIRQSESRYRGLVNVLDAGVIVHAPDTTIIMCNPKSSELLGLTKDQIKGKTANAEQWKFIDEHSRLISVEDFPVNRIIANRKPLIDFVLGINRPSINDIVWVVINGFPVIDSCGEITEIVISFIDITKRKEAEDALVASEHYLKETQVIAQLGTYTMDVLTDCWTSSEVLDEVFGIGTDYIRNTEGWVSIVHPQWQKIMLDHFLIDVIQNKKPFDKIYQIIRKNDDEIRWVHGLGALVYDSNNCPVKMIGTIQDITDRVIADEALKASEIKFRNMFENIQDVYYQVDLNGKILEISPSLNLFSEFDRSELIGESVNSLYANPEERDVFLEKLFQIGELRDYELDFKSKTGVIKHVSINSRVVYDSEGEPHHIDGAIRDITKRKNAEKALKVNETFLRETQFIAKLGIFNFDLPTNSWESSDILDSILGITICYEKTFNGWKSLIHPEWEEEVTEYFKWKVKENKALFDIKYKIIRDIDGQERWVHTMGRMYYDSNNRLVKVIGTLQDITDRKNAKQALRDSQEQLKNFAAHLQSVREEERIILAREIHDELGQILIAIKIDLGMMKQKVLKSIYIIESEVITNSFDNLFGLVDSTINTTRKIMTDLRPEVLYLLGFVEAVSLQAVSFNKRYKVNCVFINNVSDLVLNSQQTVALYRIVQESLSNVAKHSKATSVEINLDKISNKLVLQITDNGIGFDENCKKKHDSYGLIGMKERAFLLDAEFTVSSKEGYGTVVRVEIPYFVKEVSKLQTANQNS